MLISLPFLKSTRQLDFSQPIELAMGCSLTLPKLKNKRQLRFIQPIVLASSLA